MKRKVFFLGLLVVLLAATLLMACSKHDTINSESNENINFEVHIVENIETRVAIDNSFRSTFEAGDAIGLFIYKRNPHEESSVNNNELYINNVKMIYNGSSWQLTAPLYYPNDNTVLDIYAYYPYRVNASANALSYHAFTGMTDLLSAAALGVKKTDKQTIQLLFNHLLSMVLLSVDKTNAIPNFDGTFKAKFHGVISAMYNLETKKAYNPVKGVVALPFSNVNDALRRSCRIWVPAQQIDSEIVFSFSQTTKGVEIMQETAFENPTMLMQGNVGRFQVTLDTQVEQTPIYNLYDPYPKDGDYKGMVVEIYNGGRNGKVISLVNLPDSKWSTDEVSWADCTDRFEGINNMMKVQQKNNWQTLHPAFYECAIYGDRWYLPATEEAYPFLATNVRSINQNLLNIPGGEEISLYRSYFMSTEISQATVSKIYPDNGSTVQMPKSDFGKVRAFYEF